MKFTYYVYEYDKETGEFLERWPFTTYIGAKEKYDEEVKEDKYDIALIEWSLGHQRVVLKSWN